MAKRKRHFTISIVAFVATTLFISILFPKQGKFSYEYQEGRPWQHEDLITPFDFPIIKTEKEINDEILRIKSNTKQFFRYDTSKVLMTREELKKGIEVELADTLHHPDRTETVKNILNNENIRSSFILNLAKRGNGILDSLFTAGIIQTNEHIVNREEDYVVYVLINENEYNEVLLTNMYTSSEAVEKIKLITSKLEGIQGAVLESALIRSIRPNIIYDEETTLKFQNNEIDNINSSKGAINKGEIIIAKNEIVTGDKLAILDSYKVFYNKERGGLGSNVPMILGQFLFVGIIMLMLFLFILSFRSKILVSYKKTLSILSLEAVALLMVFVISQIKGVSIYILPYTILPILIRSFYDTRLALFSHIIAILMTAYFAPNNYEFLLLQLGAGMISVFTFTTFRKRSQLFITIIAIFLTYSVLYTAISLMKEGTVKDLEMYFYFFISCFLTLLTSVFIYIFEKVFKLHSEFTLLEITDINSKLLKELSEKAPGTFQHSIQVANIAEAAVRELKGDTLLVRAGALYHDIGKMMEPQYFIENQASGINPHDQLSYEDSAMKIIKHVEYGVELAKKYNLPDVVIDFIKTHHGTLKVNYFYKSFLKSNPDVEVDLSKFSYHGPIPFNKETAVLMMVDSIEAASRSCVDPDYNKLSALVDKISATLIQEKQLENSDITLKEIEKVKMVIKEKLVAIYHVRIEYPE